MVIRKPKNDQVESYDLLYTVQYQSREVLEFLLQHQWENKFCDLQDWKYIGSKENNDDDESKIVDAKGNLIDRKYIKSMNCIVNAKDCAEAGVPCLITDLNDTIKIMIAEGSDDKVCFVCPRSDAKRNRNENENRNRNENALLGMYSASMKQKSSVQVQVIGLEEVQIRLSQQMSKDGDEKDESKTEKEKEKEKEKKKDKMLDTDFILVGMVLIVKHNYKSHN